MYFSLFSLNSLDKQRNFIKFFLGFSSLFRLNPPFSLILPIPSSPVFLLGTKQSLSRISKVLYALGDGRTPKPVWLFSVIFRQKREKFTPKFHNFEKLGELWHLLPVKVFSHFFYFLSSKEYLKISIFAKFAIETTSALPTEKFKGMLVYLYYFPKMFTFRERTEYALIQVHVIYLFCIYVFLIYDRELISPN